MTRRLLLTLLLLGATSGAARAEAPIPPLAFTWNPAGLYTLPEGLALCETQSPGLVALTEGRLHYLANPGVAPDAAGVEAVLRLKRPSQGCQDVTVRFVAAPWIPPTADRWSVHWSPERPEHVDLHVDAPRLRADDRLRAQHRLFVDGFEDLPQGAWAGCPAACVWRIPLTDPAHRGVLLGSPRLHVSVVYAQVERLEAERPAATLYRGSGAALPTNRKAETREVERWVVRPVLEHHVTSSPGAERVRARAAWFPALLWESAKAAKPNWTVGTDAPGKITQPRPEELAFELPDRVHSVFRYLIPLRQKDRDGATQYARVLIYRPLSEVRALRYVRRFGMEELLLPEGFVNCKSGDRTVSSELMEEGEVPAVQGTAADCRAGRFDLELLLEPPVLTADDLGADDIALSWDPEAPDRVDIFVRSRLLAEDPSLRKRTHLAIVGRLHSTGSWDQCPRGVCRYRAQDVPRASDLRHPRIQIRSQGILPGAELYDAKTGERWREEPTEPVSLWRVAPDPVIAAPVDPNHEAETRASLPPALGRLITSAKGTGVTTVVGPAGDLVLQIDASGKKTRASVDLEGGPDLKFLPMRPGGSWPKPIAKLKARIELSRCTFAVEQLTRAFVGLKRGEVIYLMTLRKGDPERCAFDQGLVRVEKTEVGRVTRVVDERGRKTSLLRVRFFAAHAKAGLPEKPHTLHYPSGAQVGLMTDRLGILVEALPDLQKNHSVRVELPGDRALSAEGRSRLSTRRFNYVTLGGLSRPDEWVVEVASPIDAVEPCPGFRGDSREVDHIGPILRPKENVPAYCVRPSRSTPEALELRAHRVAALSSLLLPSEVGRDGLDRFPDVRVYAGVAPIATAFASAPTNLALPLETSTVIRCSTRVIDHSAGANPKAVLYEAFPKCRALVDLRLPWSLEGQPVQWSDVLAYYGEQHVEVYAKVIAKKKGASDGPEVRVAERRLRWGDKGAGRLEIGLPLEKLPGTREDYVVVQVEVRHSQAANFYEAHELSRPKSRLSVRVLRGPEYGNLYMSPETGKGLRFFMTVPTSVKSLWRSPHSGVDAKTSVVADQLESVEISLGLLGVLEPWNFDDSEPIVPLVSPQLQFGVLVGSMPSTTVQPSVSLVGGLGFRTGLSTSPQSSLESALKALVWYELLLTAASRGHPSHHVLFGFGVDVGSIVN